MLKDKLLTLIKNTDQIVVDGRNNSTLNNNRGLIADIFDEDEDEVLFNEKSFLALCETFKSQQSS